jgi:hypothetical protein
MIAVVFFWFDLMFTNAVNFCLLDCVALIMC